MALGSVTLGSVTLGSVTSEVMTLCFFRHCEEQSDEAISSFGILR